MNPTDTTFHKTEEENLEVHVHACSERYKTLFNRLNRIERILLGVAAGVGTLILTAGGIVLAALINRGLGV